MNNNKLKPLNSQQILNDIYTIYNKYNFINRNIYSKEGKYSIHYVEKYFESFNNALKECSKIYVNNITYNKQQHKPIYIKRKLSKLTKDKLSAKRKEYHKTNSNKIFDFTKKEAIQKGIELFNKEGEILKYTYLNYTNYDKLTFLNMFKSFTNFLKEANLYESMKEINNQKRGTKNNNFYYGNNKIKNFTKEDCFNKAKIILNKYNDLHKDLFLKETNYHKDIFLNMFDNSFKNFINESGLKEEIKNIRKIKHHNYNEISKTEMINVIIDCNKNCKGKFTSDYLYSNTHLTQSQIKKYFKSFSSMLLELNLKTNTKDKVTKDQILEHMWKLYNENGKLNTTIQRKDGYINQAMIAREFGSFNNMLVEMGLKTNCGKNITEQELLYELKCLVEKFGTINTIILDNECKYCRQTYLNRLGNLNEICKKLNIINENDKFSTISQIGQYCMYLFSSKLNSECILEHTFDWLINPLTNSKMRLDGYFDEYKLAIEYDGIQHYEYTPQLNKTYNDFLNRQKRDKIKDQLCKENGITLIRIRYDEKLNRELVEQKLKDHLIM